MTSGILNSPYPLQRITDAELQKLTQALWGWAICQPCLNGAECLPPRCKWSQSTRLNPFFSFYKHVTASYVPELLPGWKPALRSHGDIVDIILLLRARQHCTRATLTHEYFSRRDHEPSLADQHRAFNLVMQVITMVKCSAEGQPSAILELGTQPLQWHSNTCQTDFMLKAFPKSTTLCLENSLNHSRDLKSALTARRIQKVAKLTFEGTDDLRNHLRMNPCRGTVEIYHYTSVLKEHLAHDKSMACTSAPGLAVANVPRQVALEVLDSIQNILFPLDSDSEGILRDLVYRQSFDPDCLRYDWADGGEGDFSYIHFGGRLMDLFEEQQNPTPRSILEKWFQRKSGARFMMMATLVGILIAITVGLLGLAVSIIQAWLAYQAWKHPIATPN
ncbi:hypothetical protein CDD82_2376 [Ophiocordyceps australis]|uniref:Uncharacterized protein n=1 Tax=Ophiocordyceps australis TaxID=1399860 RepID=A0A2C5ZEK4_9HYPO|nr:hypothetical protein CDD82_2376 [Ophiocordyceps australis]